MQGKSFTVTNYNNNEKKGQTLGNMNKKALRLSCGVYREKTERNSCGISKAMKRFRVYLKHIPFQYNSISRNMLFQLPRVLGLSRYNSNKTMFIKKRRKEPRDFVPRTNEYETCTYLMFFYHPYQNDLYLSIVLT